MSGATNLFIAWTHTHIAWNVPVPLPGTKGMEWKFLWKSSWQNVLLHGLWWKVDGSKQKTLLLQLYILYCMNNKQRSAASKVLEMYLSLETNTQY